MAFFGSINSGGLFGSSGQTQIIGIDFSLISASVDAKLAQKALASLSAEDRAAFSFKSTDDGVIPPWQQIQETKTLNQQIREVRDLTKFIDLNDRSLKGLSADPDKQATFALYKALSNLRILADFASQDQTSASSLSRLNDQFQVGLKQIQEYLDTVKTDKLDLFLGDKRYTTESAVRTGKNLTGFDGSGVAANTTDALSGLVGNEVFTVSITKSGVTDDITVDLSGLSGALSLENVKNHINSQIEALTIINKAGEEVPKHLTRFDVRRDANGKFGLQIDGTLTEQVKLTAATAEPTLYVASSVSQLDSSFATTSRLTEINGLSGTLTVDSTTSFSGIDLAATEIKGLVKTVEEDDLDPRIKELRDQARAAALAEFNRIHNIVPSAAEEEDVDASSITNINSDNKVNADTSASRVAVDSEGGIYVVGSSSGSFGHQINTATGEDVFLTKFDTEGNVVFSRLLGVSGDADVYGITVDSDDNVVIVGQTDSALTTKDVIDDSKDAFVTKISKRGDEVFRYQLDTFGESGAYSVAVDSNNDIYVGGYTKSAISSTSGFSGGKDALILKLSGSTGALQDSNVFGTSGNDVIKGIAVDENDNLVVATEASGNAVVYRINGDDLTSQAGSVDFGYLGNGGSVQGLTIDNINGNVYLAGVTTNTSLDASGAATVNESAKGGFEGFVSGASLVGASGLSASFTTYLSTSGTDRINDVVVVDNVVYVAGSTGGTLDGETARGAIDTFVARLDGTSGALGDVQQFGEGLARQSAGGIAFTSKGNSVLSTLGLPTGSVKLDQTLDIETQTSATEGDFFYLAADGGARKKISLQDGDTFGDIMRKIRIAAFGKIKVEVASSSEGDKLKLTVLNKGTTIDLIAGSGDRDLLKHLGIKPGQLLSRDEVLGINEDKNLTAEEKLGGVFGLKLDGAINVKDKATAKYVLGLLDTAISTVQRAFRSLEFNPFRDQLTQTNKGTAASPQQLKQLANFQGGLQRLQASGAASSSFSFFA